MKWGDYSKLRRKKNNLIFTIGEYEGKFIFILKLHSVIAII